MSDPVRLSKVVCHQFNCSRREAELLIEGGWVMVDGEVVETPQFKVLDHVITLHPDASIDPIEPVTMLLHKPVGYDVWDGPQPALALLSADNHIADDPTRIRLLKKHFVGLQPLLPLEREECGLQVFTQDFRVARKLKEDDYKIEQEFIVEVAGEIEPGGLKLLNHGLDFNGKPLPPIKVSWQNETRLRFALKLPQPWQIEYMCDYVGLTVLSMKRLRIGRIPLAGMPPGQWRYLPNHEKF